MYIAIKLIYPAVLLSTAIIFVGLISISIINSSEQLTAEPTNETSADIDYSSTSNNNDTNFTSIFDGKTLNGWKMAGDGRFVILESDSALLSDKGGGLLWYSENKYKNFILKLEWRVSDEGDNSGVFVRFPDPDDNPNIAVREGYEVQIDDKADDPIHQTGAIYDFAAPSKVVSKPPS